MNTSLLGMENSIFSGTYSIFKDDKMEFQTVSHQELSGSLLTSYRLDHVTFIDCTFYDVEFTDSIFSNCNFVNCKFSFVKMKNCKFTNCTFENGDFLLTYSLACHFHQCSFSHMNYREGSAQNCLISKCHGEIANYFTMNDSNQFYGMFASELSLAA